MNERKVNAEGYCVLPQLREGTAALESSMRLLPPIGAQLAARNRACSIGTAGTLLDYETTLERSTAARESS